MIFVDMILNNEVLLDDECIRKESNLKTKEEFYFISYNNVYIMPYMFSPPHKK